MFYPKYFKNVEVAKDKVNTFLGWCFVIYITFCSVTNVAIFQLPQIQVSELIFIVAFPFCFIYFDKIKFTKIDVALFVYAIIFLINALYHQTVGTFLEAFGCIYLVLMSIILSRFLAYKNNFDIFLPRSMQGLFMMSVLTGVVGLSLHFLNIDHSFGYTYSDFPYLGDVWRLNGLSWNNLLLSCIAFSTFYLIAINDKMSKILLIVLASLVISVFTFSKEIVIFGTLLMLGLIAKKYLFPTKVLVSLTACLAIIMVWFTFFVMKPTNQSFEKAKIHNFTQIHPTPLFGIGAYDFYGTTYFYMARASFILATETPFFGTGSGTFSSKLEELKVKSGYPANLSVYDTHDFYWGQVAELGLLYIVFLGLFLVEFCKVLQNTLNLNKSHFIFIAFSFSYFIIAYLVGGSKQYRHFWVFVGILNYFYVTQSNGLTISDCKR